MTIFLLWFQGENTFCR